ncbi:hypothetical protein GCM10007242_16560 [Pigmentiphaga litoralis]|uniref:DUF7302 family protein n=1 Tax=Pigmentiphaga litoralis TaxID=516702 RepID=UPI001673DA35|nr:hypothetical protein [Pigmentiphaga litoralis]GGX11179.1 hypothetical protein GCM10007242_16560 [Pigmentiphaga litoralis]
MQIKTLWGFEDDSRKLGTDESRVRAGVTFTDVDPKYGHELISKGLAEEVKEAPKAAPKTTKPAAPTETK